MKANTSNEALISQEYLKSILHYDPETGIFTWLIRPCNSMQAGDIAGSLDKPTGYIRISINRILYLSHRLAWLYMTGNWPLYVIDHELGIDIPNFNKWDNLRQITHKENTRSKLKNGGICSNNTTGYRGVDFHKGIYRGRVTIDGVQICVGYFNNAEEAGAACEKARTEYFIINDI